MMHVMCGIPSSGKTTLSKQLALEYNAILYCYDTLPRKHWSDDNHSIMYENIIQALSKGNVVICDDLHITEKMRKRLINALENVECIKILHVMQTNLHQCIERNHRRDYGKLPDLALKHCYAEYESPTLDEGWDEIIYHEYIEEVIPHDN